MTGQYAWPYTPRDWSRTTLPYSSSITRLRMESTMAASCVAITTVVPVRLIRSSTFIMPIDVAGSMFPVGSSASRSISRVKDALALETDQVDHLRDDLLDEAPLLADHFEGERDVLVDALVRQQPEVLEHAPDAPPQVRQLPVG